MTGPDGPALRTGGDATVVGGVTVAVGVSATVTVGVGMGATVGDAVTVGWATGAVVGTLGAATLGAVTLVTFETKASVLLGSATTDPGVVAGATDAVSCSQLGTAAF